MAKFFKPEAVGKLFQPIVPGTDGILPRKKILTVATDVLNTIKDGAFEVQTFEETFPADDRGLVRQLDADLKLKDPYIPVSREFALLSAAMIHTCTSLNWFLEFALKTSAKNSGTDKLITMLGRKEAKKTAGLADRIQKQGTLFSGSKSDGKKLNATIIQFAARFKVMQAELSGLLELFVRVFEAHFAAVYFETPEDEDPTKVSHEQLSRLMNVEGQVVSLKEKARLEILDEEQDRLSTWKRNHLTNPQDLSDTAVVEALRTLLTD